MAVEWWKLDVAEPARARGYARCDSRSAHEIALGGGFLCNPSRMGDHGPELVCEACYDEFPYDPWDGGYSGLRAGPYKTMERALAALKRKKWWQFWK